jgi:hypothetical protein
MAVQRKSLQEVPDLPAQPVTPPKMDEATRDAIIRESADRYQRFVEELNRASDSEIERALRASSRAAQ